MSGTTIAVIGSGHVGLVTGATFAEVGHDVLCVDNDAKKIETLQQGKLTIYEPGLEEMVANNRAARRLRFGTSIAEAVSFAEVIFIAVSTPPLPSGAADLSAVVAVSREIGARLADYRVVVEKSTVPVQTGARVKAAIAEGAPSGAAFDVVSNPEFLREGSAVNDTLHPDRIVIGVESERAKQKMLEVYAPFRCETVVTDIQSAELIKHASNSFLAMKISFINAVANVCELTGANAEEVARGMGLDPRIGKSFLQPGLGYGGSCFPKDVDAFRTIAEQLGYNFDLLREVQRINQEQRQRFLAKIERELGSIRGRRIGVWGLSFKPNTDDVRDSPAIRVCSALAEAGAIVRAFDPKATVKARAVLPGAVALVDDPYEAARDAECLAVCTEWDAFKSADLAKVRALMAKPIVVDGRNCWSPAEMKTRGFVYRSVGR